MGYRVNHHEPVTLGSFTQPPSVDGSHWLCMGRSRNALWVRQSIRLRGLLQKVEKCSTLQAAADPSANQFLVMQIHATRLLDPLCNNKQEEAGKICPLYFLKKCGMIRFSFWVLLADIHFSSPTHPPTLLCCTNTLVGLPNPLYPIEVCVCVHVCDCVCIIQIHITQNNNNYKVS